MTPAPTAWFEQEDLWVETYPLMFGPEKFRAAVEDVPKLLKLAGRDSGAALDLGCGPGRFAVPLAKRGFTVTGVDRTAFLLDKARTYATEESADVEWVLEDMRRFRRGGAFDIALSLFSTFGYFEDPADNRHVLENVFASLKRGGIFVMDLLGKEILAGKFRAIDAEELYDGTLLVQRRTIMEDWSRIIAEWILLKEMTQRSFKVRLWIYSAQELKALLREVGFSTVSVYGTMDGTPYGPDAKRLIAVAGKA
jgi:2-polyprenyl-3-methyl-5-hydroxy-6-metoxy-1,4-benzoquinol methylase